MRVISGKFKKTNLYLPKKIDFRPTSDFVKESLFSSLQNFIDNSIFLDIFCGSGNVGLEALSRGCKKVFFNDNSWHSINILKKNLQLLKIDKNSYEILKMNFKAALRFFFKHEIFFDIIFADPPYEKGYVNKFLKSIYEFNVLKKEGILVIQHSFRENIKDETIFKTLKHGDTVLSFIKIYKRS